MVNDRPPSGVSFPADPPSDFSYAAYDSASHEQSAYGSYEPGGYDSTGWNGHSPSAYGDSAAAYGDGDPLFGSMPGSPGAATYDTGAYASGSYGAGSYDTGGYGTGAYDAGGWGTGAYGTGGYAADTYATGGHDAAAWAEAGYQHGVTIPQQYGPEQAADHGYPAPADATTQWDVSAYDTTGWDGAAQNAYGYGAPGAAPGATAYDTGDPTGGHDATTWGGGMYGAAGQHAAEGHDDPQEQHAQAYEAYEAQDAYGPAAAAYDGQAYEGEAYQDAYDGGHHGPAHPGGAYDDAAYREGAYDDGGAPQDAPYAEPDGVEAEPEPLAAAVIPAPQGRGRRRSPKPRRSALLTVAAPSVCVLGVAGVAAASMGGPGDDTEDTQQASAPDPGSVEPSAANSKLDTQLAVLSDNADDFADRASRTQERIDLKKRQEEERKRKAEEAARKEALRPKFALPVEGAGISAYYGQAGINWMSVHSGVDFPVSYGTAVKAATDGTVSTKWDPSYGNMIIVTAADGTETWYCHLSSTRIRSGPVQAGDVIGYSGNSGNSTGPHLHFEVRPGGGAAIDPVPWFRSHGLEPS